MAANKECSASYNQHVLESVARATVFAVDVGSGGCKEYISFPDLDAALDWYAQNVNKKSCYEMLRVTDKADMPTSLAFDIDLDPTKVDKLTGVCQGKERLDWLRKKYPANAEELGKLNEEVFLRVMLQEIEESIPELQGAASIASHAPKFLTTPGEAPALVKLSFHIKFPGFLLTNHHSRQEFKYVLKQRLGHLSPLVDIGVYGRNRAMRLLYSAKQGSPRRLVPYIANQAYPQPEELRAITLDCTKRQQVRDHMWSSVDAGAKLLATGASSHTPMAAKGPPRQPRAQNGPVLNDTAFKARFGVTVDCYIDRATELQKLFDYTVYGRPKLLDGSKLQWQSDPRGRKCVHGNCHTEDTYLTQIDSGFNILTACLAEECKCDEGRLIWKALGSFERLPTVGCEESESDSSSSSDCEGDTEAAPGVCSTVACESKLIELIFYHADYLIDKARNLQNALLGQSTIQRLSIYGGAHSSADEFRLWCLALVDIIKHPQCALTHLKLGDIYMEDPAWTGRADGWRTTRRDTRPDERARRRSERRRAGAVRGSAHRRENGRVWRQSAGAR